MLNASDVRILWRKIDELGVTTLDAHDGRARFAHCILKRVTDIVIGCLQVEHIRDEVFHLRNRVGAQDIDRRPTPFSIDDQFRTAAVVILECDDYIRLACVIGDVKRHMQPA